MNEVKVYDYELVQFPAVMEGLLIKHLARAKGVPFDGYCIPEFKKDVHYEITYSLEDFATVIRWHDA